VTAAYRTDALDGKLGLRPLGSVDRWRTLDPAAVAGAGYRLPSDPARRALKPLHGAGSEGGVQVGFSVVTPQSCMAN
jgi:hypothetical protein